MKNPRKILTIRGAAAWMGCSPEFIRWLRKYGWIKSQGRHNLPAYKTEYQLSDLAILAWDIAYSLSFYDIVAIRKSEMTREEIARKGGLPLRVVEIVQTGYVFGWIVALLERYSARRTERKIDNADVDPPFPPNPFTLSVSLSKTILPKTKAWSLGSANPVRTRFGLGSSSPGCIEKPSAERLFSRRGLAVPSTKGAPTQLWTSEVMLQASKELQQSDLKHHEHPNEPQCQKESEQ